MCRSFPTVPTVVSLTKLESPIAAADSHSVTPTVNVTGAETAGAGLWEGRSEYGRLKGRSV